MRLFEPRPRQPQPAEPPLLLQVSPGGDRAEVKDQILLVTAQHHFRPGHQGGGNHYSARHVHVAGELKQQAI